LKVLIAEDDTQVRDYVSMLLESGLDCEIMEASSGNEAVAILEFDSQIDLLITEVKMVGGGGHVIVDYLSDSKIEVPIVWLSQAENKDVMIVQEVLSRNSLNAFSAKPFKDDEFFPIVERIFEAIKKPTPANEGKNTKENTRENEALIEASPSSNSIEENFYGRTKKNEGDHSAIADYSLEMKSKNHAEGKADYSLEMKSKNHAEGEADYSLEMKSKNHAEGEADYSLEMKSKNHAEGEADYSLEMKSKNHAEGEADYSLEMKSKNHAEGEADYSLEMKSKNHAEEEADYSIKKTFRGKNSEGVDVVYRPIKLKRFYNFDSICCDAYIKLGEEKFVKLLTSNQAYDKELLEKYQGKGIEILFIEEGMYEGFCAQFSNLVSARLKISQKLNGEIQNIAQLAAFESTRTMAREFGVSELAATKVKESVEANLKSLSQLPDLATLMQRILRGGDYISERSLLVSYFAGQICLKTSWSSTSALEKLSMAAIMHDVALEHNHLAKVNSLEGLKALCEEDALSVQEHPGKAAQIISQGESIFSDVESILLQHHEKPDQTGFPKGLGALSISPLSCIFILASEFAYEVYGKPSNQVDIENIKSRFQETYKKGNFKKPLEAFLSAF
jgi:response regulator RpfG family c-di-GMP phosphodiesterase